jgi:hypothetical protein
MGNATAPPPGEAPPTARAGNAPGVAEQQTDGNFTAYQATIRGQGGSRSPCLGPVMANPIRTLATPRPQSTRKILCDKQLDPHHPLAFLFPLRSHPPSSPGAAASRHTPKMTSVAAPQVASRVWWVYDPQPDEGPYARPSLVGFGVYTTPNLTRDGRAHVACQFGGGALCSTGASQGEGRLPAARGETPGASEDGSRPLGAGLRRCRGEAPCRLGVAPSGRKWPPRAESGPLRPKVAPSGSVYRPEMIGPVGIHPLRG